MSYEVLGLKVGVLTASADLSSSQYRFVKSSGSGTVGLCTAASDTKLGVLQNKPASGQVAEIMADGVSKVTAGAAINAGQKVMSDSAGRAVPYVPGPNAKINGVALETVSAAGQVVAVYLECLAETGLTSVTFAAAAGASNVCNVTGTVKDADGNTLTGVRNLELWLSDAATGIGATATTASGTVTCTTGTDLADTVAKKVKTIQTAANGTFVLAITDTAKTGFYVCVKHPGTGVPLVSAQLTAANYG